MRQSKNKKNRTMPQNPTKFILKSLKNYSNVSQELESYSPQSSKQSQLLLCTFNPATNLPFYKIKKYPWQTKIKIQPKNQSNSQHKQLHQFNQIKASNQLTSSTILDKKKKNQQKSQILSAEKLQQLKIHKTQKKNTENIFQTQNSIFTKNPKIMIKRIEKKIGSQKIEIQKNQIQEGQKNQNDKSECIIKMNQNKQNQNEDPLMQILWQIFWDEKNNYKHFESEKKRKIYKNEKMIHSANKCIDNVFKNYSFENYLKKIRAQYSIYNHTQ